MADVTKHIVDYDSTTLRSFISSVQHGYDESKKINIPYDVWAERASIAITSSPVNFDTILLEPGLVRYTDTATVYKQLKSISKETTNITEEMTKHPERTIELNQQLFDLQYTTLKPLQEFHYDGFVEINGNKAWYASSMKGVNIRIGPENLDLSTPTGFTLGDSKVHANVQGSTGSGKTVMIHNLIFNVSLEYPPWEVDLKLIDNKIAEFHLYGSSIQSPHASVVAATKAKEFLLDLYNSFVEETQMRQEIFNATQVKDKKSFRQKFNLNLPEVLIIIDEYVAMLLAIEDTASMGNQKSGEEKAAIESTLLTMATQSRNAGVHFLISSQDLGSKLNESISKQIHVGATLYGTSDIYSGCINNSEVVIDRKGFCVMNQERMQKDNGKYNKIVGVPYLIAEDVPGKLLNPAQELLSKIAEKSRELGFKKDFFYYNAASKISYKEFEQSLLECVSTTIDSDGDVLYQIPIGKAIRYRNVTTSVIEVNNRKGDNIFYYCKNDELSRYVAQIILTVCNVTYDDIGVNIYYTEPSALKMSGLSEYNIPKNIERIKMISAKYWETYKQRSSFMRVQETVFLKAGSWDINTLIRTVLSMLPRNEIATKYKNKCEVDIPVYLSGSIKLEEMEILFEDVAKQDLTHFTEFVNLCRRFCAIRASHNLKPNERFMSNMFKPIVNFWFGIEDIDNLSEDWVKEGLNDLFTGSTTVNILNVANSGAPFKIRRLLGGFNNVVEFADKVFWNDAEFSGSYIANVNTDSVVLHDIRKTAHTITKIYGGI